MRWSYTLKCDGVPYKEDTLKCNGLTRLSAMASLKKEETLKCDGLIRQSALVVGATHFGTIRNVMLTYYDVIPVTKQNGRTGG